MRYPAGWDLLAAVTPEPLMSLARRFIGDDRALTQVDRAGGAAYHQRVADQAARRSA